ncbi:MAG: condensation domain-containing protein, partial [Blastocatellia bacterium]
MTSAHERSGRPADENRHEQRQSSVSETTTLALHALAGRHHVTLNTLMLGVWAALLSRYSGEKDVLFGSVVSGRPPELCDVEATVGLFINTLPVRVFVDADARFVEWIKELQSRQTEARQFEFSPLVEAQRWSGVTPGRRLFDHFLAFENYPGSNDELWPGEDLPALHTGYPLYVLVKPGAELSLKIIYSAHFFSDAAITRMLGHLSAILEGVVRGPGSELGALPLLSDSERRALIFDANRTELDLPLDLSYIRQFQRQAAATPSAMAVRCAAHALTYEELDRLSDRAAGWLRKSGVSPGALAPLLAERGSYYLAALLGVMKAGAVYLPLDPQQPPARQTALLKQTGVESVICAAECRNLLVEAQFEAEQEQRKLSIVELSQLFVETAGLTEVAGGVVSVGEEIGAEIEAMLGPDELAYVIYTSGSTGTPKGVMIEQRGMLNHLHAKC